MPSYLNVPEVKEYGSKVVDRPKVMLLLGERLVAIIDNGEYQLAEDVTAPEALKRLHSDVARKVWTNISLYVVEKDDMEKGNLTGGCRFNMDDTPVRDPGKWLCPR